MADHIVRQHPGMEPVSCLYDQSLLDTGLPYPADMSGLPTSTPNPANLRRKSRRSWFENTPNGAKFEIAIEKPHVSPKAIKRRSEDVEVLTLTHFTAAPRLGFGNVKIGQTKTCTLLLRNPHDYEQTVKLEKVPVKKHFSVSIKEVKVGAGDSYPLDITWTPEEPGGVREMLLMQVDAAYRLQAYVYGTVVAPPPKKKTKRTGLLATKATRPFSVIHTNSLASINHEYSPEKKAKVASKAGRQPPASNGHRVVAQPLKNRVRKSGEGNVKRRSARLSGGKNDLASKENHSPVPVNDIEQEAEFVEPLKKSRVSSTVASNEITKIVKHVENIPNRGRVGKKQLRRSNTYNNVSVGMVVPVIKGAEVQGMLDTSLLGECDISGIKVLDEMPETQSRIGGELPSFIDPEEGRLLCSHPSTIQTEPSFLENEERIEKQIIQTNLSLKENTLEPSFLQDNSIVGSFQCSSMNTNKKNCDNIVGKGKDINLHSLKNPLVANILSDTFHDSLESSPQIKNSQNIELPSFLEEEKPRRTGVQRRSLRRRSRRSTDLENCQPTEVTLLKNAKRRSGRCKINIDVSMDDIQDVIKIRSRNDSGQSNILSQLKMLKSFIHEKSYEIESGGESSITKEEITPAEIDRRETFVKRRTSPRFAIPSSDINIRRGTFVPEAAKIKLLEEQKPSEASPRRTTFTVVKKAVNGKSPYRSHSEGPVEVTELRSRSKSVNYHLTEQINEVEAIEEPSFLKVEAKDMTSEIQKNISTNSEAESDGSPAKQRFSADSLDGDVQNSDQPSFECQFHSPKELPVNPQFGRRSTLTVTKSRPSDALMEQMRRSSQVALFSASPDRYKASGDYRNISAIAENTSENCERTPATHSSQNSTFEVPSSKDKSGMTDSSFPTTPLPNSPQLDTSRRSTHIVEKPRVLTLGISDKKQLFRPSKGLVQYDDSPSNESEMSELHTGASNASTSIETVEEKLKQPFDNSEEFPDVFSPPSANTRRRTLSARRQLSANNKSKNDSIEAKTEQRVEKTIESKKDCIFKKTVKENAGEENFHSGQNQETESGQLFFVSLDDRGEQPKPALKQTAKKDPSNFLKKRSNPVVQAEEKRGAKRIKSDGPEVALRKRTNSLKAAVPVRPGRIDKKASIPAQAKQPTLSSGDSKPLMSKPRTTSVKGLAQSKLILMKKSKTALPKHPLPFAAKNMYYDERWMEKQERGFVNWLNFILTPAEEYQATDIRVKVDAGKLSIDVNKGTKLAPTNEVLSFRAYSAHRKLNRLRKSACRLFQSESVIRVVQKIESEVESGRLMVRKDKMLHADLGAKQKILDMFLSYNPLWLRVGIETIYGEVVPLQSNSDVYGLSRFIITRLVSSPDIALEFAHPTVPHLYRDGYAEATAQHTLKKFLLVVYFLDIAKQERLIEHNPCLFCKDSEFKATKDLLLQFSRNFLSGEGDITRHLSYLGYKVSYTQTALDEFDFAVSKLAVDLRDGLRLNRVLELLCGKPELSRNMRVPAISRLQKIHNMEVVFKTFADQGLPTSDVSVRDIVDGHRERTLKLLWSLILHHQVSLLLNEEQLREEVVLLQRSLTLRHNMDRILNYASAGMTKRDSHEPDLHTQSPLLNLLLQWCRCVCAFYNIKVENFTVSFSDGRALCHIVHHYHPGLLPLALIQQQTSLTHWAQAEEGSQSHDVSANDSISSSAVFGDMADPEEFQLLLANEKENFKVLCEKVKELGGVPLLLKWSDMSNTIPDEKVVVTYLLYLCARLLDIRHECRAARVIQLAWRHYRLRKMEAELKVKSKAASVIQQAVLGFLARRRAMRREVGARCIQRVWRGHHGRKLARAARLEREMAARIQMVLVLQKTARMVANRRRFLGLQTVVVRLQRLYRAKLVAARCRQQFLETHRAVVKIQTVYRSHLARKSYKTQQAAATVLQANIRCFLARKRLRKIKQVARTIQSHVRAYQAMKQCRQEFLATKAAAVTLQSVYRGQRTRRELQQRLKAAIVLQANFRMIKARRDFNRLKKSAILLQNYFRQTVIAKAWRRHFLIQKGAAMTIQAFFRGHRVRQYFRKQAAYATVIQSHVRMFIVKQRFMALKKAALTLQVRHRANLASKSCQRKFLISKGAAITIQAFYRGHLVRRALKEQHRAATQIQTGIKMYFARKQFVSMRKAASTLQKYHRANALAKECRKEFIKKKSATVTIQSHIRGFLARRAIKQQHVSATLIQARYRGYVARQQLVKTKEAALLIQRCFRNKIMARLVRQQFIVSRQAAMTIQSGFRGYCVRKKLQKQTYAATTIQSWYRMVMTRKKFNFLKSAVQKMQARHRANMAAKLCRRQFLISKGAAMSIQAAFKGYCVRKELHKQNSAAKTIQSWYRMYAERRKFNCLRSAVQKMQTRHRANMAAKLCRRQFLITKGAAITIQAFARGHMARKVLKKEVTAATKIQAFVRMNQARNKFLHIKKATATIQRHFLAYKQMQFARRGYLIQKGAAITIQAVFKGFKVRQKLKVQHEAAIAIQSRFRGYLQSKKFAVLKLAVITCQKKYRRKIMANKIKANYDRMRMAVVTLQSAYRRMKCQRAFSSLKKITILIQSYARMFIARKKYMQMRRAANSIQVWYRSKKLTDQCRHRFLIQKGAAITIQAHIKGFLFRRLYVRFKAARTLQYACKTIAARQKYLRTRQQVIQCQAAVRAYLARRQVAQLKQRHKAATVIQHHWRAKLASRQQRDVYIQLRSAALSIQKLYRAKYQMQKCKRNFLIQKGAAITIQAVVRGWLARSQQKKAVKAATCIQTAFRGFIEHKRYNRAVHVIRVCQQVWKARLYGRIQLYKYLEMKECAILIQSYVRMHQCQTRYHQLREAALYIQSWYRGARERKALEKHHWAARVLQARWRAEILCRRHVIQYVALKEMAILIQSHCRGKLARQQVKKVKAAVCIQSYCRMLVEKRRFLQRRSAAVKIQCQVRVLLARRCLHRLRTDRCKERLSYLERVATVTKVNLAAINIQRCYRNYRMMKAAQEKLQSIIAIQRWFRTYRQRLKYLRVLRRVVRIQACVRMWLARRDRAARVIQRVVRGWLSTFEDRKKRRSATTIQARWRGYILRKKSKSKKLAETRRRVLQATESATEEKKLGNRTASALDYLLKYKHLSQVLDALMHLEVATRLASACCERMVEVNAVTVLYQLVRSCNRSLPHMEIIKYTICVMLNLAKYEKTRHSLYEDYEGVKTLVELLQMYREKKGPIFTKTCTLLGILALDEHCKSALLADKKTIEKLKSIHMLTARKHKMEENQRVVRAKMNATLNSTYVVRQPTKRHSIQPEWNLHKDRMAEIENPLRAIDFVLLNLGVAVK